MASVVSKKESAELTGEPGNFCIDIVITDEAGYVLKTVQYKNMVFLVSTSDDLVF